jgi:hypothetical protein
MLFQLLSATTCPCAAHRSLTLVSNVTRSGRSDQFSTQRPCSLAKSDTVSRVAKDRAGEWDEGETGGVCLGERRGVRGDPTGMFPLSDPPALCPLTPIFGACIRGDCFSELVRTAKRAPFKGEVVLFKKFGRSLRSRAPCRRLGVNWMKNK